MLGMIVRADEGGLGAQTHEAWRHLRPDRTLVINPGDGGRGTTDLSRYSDARVRVEGLELTAPSLAWLAACERVFTVETPYSARLGNILDLAGHRLVVQANPELWRPEYGPADVWLPTSWEAARIPDALGILAVPTSTPTPGGPQPRVVDHVQTFVHVVAPAMHDRNGTDVVLGALQHVQHPCTLILHDPTGSYGGWNVRRAGRVRVDVRSVPLTDRWAVYRDADALLFPRRYGGLALPVQEAATLGLPVVATDLEPLRGLPFVETLPPGGAYSCRMKGGDFQIHNPDPREVASAMDRLLAADEERTQMLSTAALTWAADRSWDRLLPAYNAILRP